MAKKIIVLFILFFTTKITAGVRADTLIATRMGLIPVTELIRKDEVYCYNEQGKLTVSGISKVSVKKEMIFYYIKIRGKNIFGIEKEIEIVGSPDQRIYCPNREKKPRYPGDSPWVKFCEVDPEIDIVYTRYCEPTPIISVRQYHFYVYNFHGIIEQTAPAYSFEVKKYGMFFASELLVPLHNSAAVVIPPLIIAAEFVKPFLINIATALIVAGTLEAFDNYTAPKKTPENQSSKTINTLEKNIQNNECVKPPETVEKPKGCGLTPEAHDAFEKSKSSGCNTPQQEPKIVINSTPLEDPKKNTPGCGNLPEKQSLCDIACSAEKTKITPQPINPPTITETIQPTENINSPGITPIPLEVIVQEGIPSKTSGGKSTVYIKPGNYENAVQDFWRLGPTEVREFFNKDGQIVIAGTLPNGTNINVRIDSTDTRPTLEVQHSQYDYTKIRYGNK